MKQWEKEFSKRFTDNVLPDGYGNDLITTKEDVEPLMNFIQQTLDQQKAEFVEMVRGMKSDEPSDNGLTYPVGAVHKSYNQAISDIVKALDDV